MATITSRRRTPPLADSPPVVVSGAGVPTKRLSRIYPSYRLILIYIPVAGTQGAKFLELNISSETTTL